jgi:hypothetical protein
MSHPEVPKLGLVSEVYASSHDNSGSEHKHSEPNELNDHGTYSSLTKVCHVSC